MKRTIYLQRMQQCNTEQQLGQLIRQIVARDEQCVVYREPTVPLLFTVCKPVERESDADTLIEVDPSTRIRTDDFDLAVYALYRPNTLAWFDFYGAVVFEAQKSLPEPNEA
jgi:hypothetical protein